jgi:nucleotide-binding universal stress UspA family protein
MKKILIAIDGGEAARAALEVGLDLAEEENAEVVFVHVTTLVDLGLPVADGPHAPANRVPVPEDDPVIREALARAGAAAVPARGELLMGYAPKQIARFADEIDADTIVVGARSLGRLRRAILGSTSRALLTETSLPVLIVGETPVASRATT